MYTAAVRLPYAGAGSLLRMRCASRGAWARLAEGRRATVHVKSFAQDDQPPSSGLAMYSSLVQKTRGMGLGDTVATALATGAGWAACTPSSLSMANGMAGMPQGQSAAFSASAVMLEKEPSDGQAFSARNARSRRGIQAAKASGKDGRVALRKDGPAATATYGVIALVVGIFIVCMIANLANGYLRPSGQFWLYHKTLSLLKKNDDLVDKMGGAIVGVYSRRTSQSRVNLLQCAEFQDDDGVPHTRLKFYIVPKTSEFDDAAVVFVDYDTSRCYFSFMSPKVTYLIVQLIATGEQMTLWENGERKDSFLPLQ